jgi:tyrosyl-tRNA synthetase
MRDLLDELVARGQVAQTTDAEALRKDLSGGSITFYAGFDPTADSLHVGHLCLVMLMRRLQRAGHKAIAVVGGGTGMVGDPTGKTEMRQMLDADAIRRNLEAQRGQLSRFLVLDPPNGRMVDNAEWLMGLGYISFLRDIGRHFSVNRMLSAETYKARLETGLSFIEFNYQILQAYDYLELHQRYQCTLQVGGDDQWSNILAGHELVRRVTGNYAHALTIPLLTTASGAKMGKTVGGAVWLDGNKTPPFDFYQYWLNVDDRDVGRFLRIFSDLSIEEIATYEALVGADIRLAKRKLAEEVTRLAHGEEALQRATQATDNMLAGKASDQMDTHAVARADLSAGIKVVAVLADAGLTKSKGEARKLIQNGGVSLNGQKVTDVDATLEPSLSPEGVVLRVGKQRAVRVVAAS